ncbi:cell wall-binding repeat-containing protein [Leifsonia sp. fls2-241-R2A-40a]|uniref:cell wall-binding repeat-containing protein n=1 Tax=Leifsonia sp. fls2-241-R2A-40a TaxID=3040290 RepID=UPI00255078DA|nr:cell wall-binding repeat-containing protein [Leifsonia sp. fls2-241-R2A-40a]
MKLRAVAAITAALTLCGVGFAVPAAASSPVAKSALSAGATVPVAQLATQLSIADDSTQPYNRSDFPTWIDADHDGCNTRSEVLQQESAVPVTFGSGCTVATGSWSSWYDGATWTAASDVDIDHFVPLAEVWRSGASGWSLQQRTDYANDLSDPLTLVAVTDNVNQSKSDSDIAHWLPPLTSARCTYAVDWVVVKYRWSLTMDPMESNALNSLLGGACGSTAVTVPARVAVTPAAGVDRIAGSDRYETSVRASQAAFPGTAPIVFVASGTNFPDALSAAPAAVHLGGPLLLTAPGTLPAVVKAEVARLQPTTAVIVGGSSAVGVGVESSLRSIVGNVQRLSGYDRYDTSVKVNRFAFATGATTAFVATGANFPDALSASAAAGSDGSMVLLVNGAGGAIPNALLDDLGVTQAIIAGGTAVVSPTIENQLRARSGMAVSRLAGGDRYETSHAINRGVFSTSPTVYFATGTNFPDALSGAALAGRTGSALYVVPAGCVPDYVPADLSALQTTHRVLLGGTSVLANAVGSLSVCPPPPPAPPAPPVPPAPPGPPANPGDSKNCSDFPTQSAAQAWFNYYFPYYGDVARLDADHDGKACESLPG